MLWSLNRALLVREVPVTVLVSDTISGAGYSRRRKVRGIF